MLVWKVSHAVLFFIAEFFYDSLRLSITVLPVKSHAEAGYDADEVFHEFDLTEYTNPNYCPIMNTSKCRIFLGFQVFPHVPIISSNVQLSAFPTSLCNYTSYRQSVKKWPVIVDFLATEVGIIAFLVFASYAHLPFALFFFSMLGAFFSSTGNLACRMNDWENPDIKTTIQISNQNMITDSDFTKLSPTRFIVNRLGRWFRHESVIKIGDRLYSHSSPCKDELMYSDEEAIDFVRDSAEISNHYINEVKYEPVDDAIIVVDPTAEANKSNFLRKDIIDRARKELPEHSPILKVISTMVNDHEVDLATLAKLEASLHQLDKKVENVGSMNVEQQSLQAD
jgi:hypothetical protein